MVGHELHVDQAATRLGEPGDQVDQGDLGGVGGVVEHGLTGEHAADAHPVQAADQLVDLPDLEAVRVAEPVQLHVGPAHLREDPGALGPVVLGAGRHHRLEGPVDGSLPARAAQALP